MKYIIIIDNSTQWFCFIAKVNDKNEYLEYFNLDNKIRNPYLDNIFNKPTNFGNFRFSNSSIPAELAHGFSGFYVSEYDYCRIKRMTELYSSVKEYERLGKLE